MQGNERAQPEPWSVAGQVQLMPGYAHGLAYPSAILNVAVPALTSDQRSARWEDFLGLFEGIADLPALPHAPDPANGANETDQLATISWLAELIDHLPAMAELPIVQGTACVGIAGPIASFAVPGLLASLQLQVQLVAQALASFQPGPNARARQAFQDLFAQLRETRHRNSNIPRTIRAAAQNGIAFQEIAETQSIQYGLGRKAVLFDSTYTQFTSALGARLARNKHEAAAILRRHRLPVPAHQLAANEEDALRIAESLGYPAVVKPANMDRGIAVRAGLTTPQELLEAFRLARQSSNLVLVEQFVRGNDYRLTVFGDQCVWAVERQPAGVTGDGSSTIGQLVDQANMDPARGDGSHSPLKRLVIDDEALGLLGRENLGLDSMPEAGRFIRLRQSSNVSSGGTPVAVTEKLHPDNAELAVRAAQALHLDIAGVDLIIPDIAVSWRESGGMICEVNAQPQLGGTTGNHLYPLMLKTMLGGDGHVPVIAILGGNQAERISQRLADDLAARGIRAGLHNRSGIAIGNAPIERGAVAQLAAGRMLSMNRAVDLLIFGATDARLLQDGFPVPRIDVLLLTGDYLDRTGDGTGIADAHLIRIALRMLVPATREVALLDSASDPANDVVAALGELRIPYRVVPEQAVIHHAEQLHRAS